MQTPVIVAKDVGGYVADYQTQTELYRASGREVRLHECRSACTMALSLPNVCVYPDSTLKFHLAYDPRNHQTNPDVSKQLFDSYPAAVRARLGTLTREYKVMRGSELIALGIRDCRAPKTNEPTLVAAAAASRNPALAPQKPLFASLVDKMLSVFGAGGEAPGGRESAAGLRRPLAKPAPHQLLEGAPLPPLRPAEFAQADGALAAPAAIQTPNGPASEGAGEPAGRAGREEAAAQQIPLPPPRRLENGAPLGSKLIPAQRPKPPALPRIIIGAQPILPPGFSAYVALDR